MSETSTAIEPLDFDGFCRQFAGTQACLVRGEVFATSPVGQEHIHFEAALGVGSVFGEPRWTEGE